MRTTCFTVAACLTLAVLTAAADYRSTVLSQGPVGYWRLNEATVPPMPVSAATNLGSVGAAGDGVYTNGVVKGVGGTLPGEPSNRAAAFNRRVNFSNRVLVPFRPEWNMAGPFTVEFWARPGQTEGIACPAASFTLTTNYVGSGWLFGQGELTVGSGNGWYFTLYREENGLATRTASVALSLNTNSWYHIVGSYDGTNMNLYLNGALANSMPLDDVYRPVSDTTSPMTFGSRSDQAATVGIGPGWLGYIGSLDEPALYTNALSPARILAHYQAGTNGSPSTLYSTVILADAPAGYWRLNESANIIPTATNSGTLGAAGNGGYVYNTNPGQNAPATPDYAGFETTNVGIGLDGGPGYVSLPALNLNTNTVTITAWLKRDGDQPTNTAIVFNRAGGTVAGLKFDKNPSLQELSYNWGDAAAPMAFRSELEIPDDQWVFAALIVHPDFAVLALQDGVSFNWVTNFTTHAPLPFEFETRIGSDARKPATGFTGWIDEVAIFNRSLSVGEVYSQYASAAGNLAPQIFAEPQVEPAGPVVGDPLTLSVDAGGTPPLSYQWRRNGTNVGGATGPVYSIPVAQNSDTGDYDVIVTSPFGSVTGQIVAVSMTQQSVPLVTQDPLSRTLFSGGVARFTVGATGGQLAYQWRKGTNEIDGANQSSFTIGSVTSTNSGDYSVRISNALGAATSAPAVLTVTIPAPASYEGLVSADGPESWWRLNEATGSTNMLDSFGRHDGIYTGATLGTPGAVLGGDTAVTFDGSGFGEVPYSPALNRDSFTIEVWARGSAAMQGRAGGVVSSFSSAGHADGRGIASLKFDQDLWSGMNGKGDGSWYWYNDLGLFAPNTWTHWAVTVSGGSVVWYLNGAYRLGPYADSCARNLSAPFYVGALQPGGGFSYYWNGDIDEVVYYGKALTREQIQAHYLAAAYGTNSPPSILQQPISRTVIEGGTAQFNAVASGNPPILLQWFRDGSPLSGQTNSTLKVTNVWYTDEGEYWLQASNAGGPTNSAHATLTVMPPPAFAGLTNGLVLHLKFDDDVLDSSGRANDGMTVGNVGFVPGRFGHALHYYTDAGVGDFNYVTLGLADDLQFSSNVDFSVAYWVRTPTGAITGDLPFLCNSTNSFGGPGYTFAPSYNGGTWSWSLNSVYVYGGNLINNGQWHHLVHTFVRGGVATTFLDGERVDERPAGGFNDVDSGFPTNIGQGSTGDYPESGEADLDDIGVWRLALSSYQAQSIYYAAKDYGRTFDVVGSIPLRIYQAGSQIELIWQTGTLYQSDQLGGPWTPVPGAVAPHHKLTPGLSKKFYRVM